MKIHLHSWRAITLNDYLPNTHLVHNWDEKALFPSPAVRDLMLLTLKRQRSSDKFCLNQTENNTVPRLLEKDLHDIISGNLASPHTDYNYFSDRVARCHIAHNKKLANPAFKGIEFLKNSNRKIWVAGHSTRNISGRISHRLTTRRVKKI
jgi:hypothetical protein